MKTAPDEKYHLLPSELDLTEEEHIYTSDEALEHSGMGIFQWSVLFSCCLVNTISSMIILQSAVLVRFIQCDLPDVTDTKRAFLASITFIGYFIGNVFLGNVNDTYGRKRCVLI